MKTLNHFYANPNLNQDSDYVRVYLRASAPDNAVLVTRRRSRGAKEVFVVSDQVNGDNRTHRYVFLYNTFAEAFEKVEYLRGIRKTYSTIIKSSGVIRMWVK